jgi:hypothetical protein
MNPGCFVEKYIARASDLHTSSLFAQTAKLGKIHVKCKGK